jgi:uncharacterized protein YyaL (SSP411 family)
VRRSLAPVARHLPQLAFKSGALLWPPNTLVMARNMVALTRGLPWHDELARRGPDGLAHALDDALGWICRSQDRVGSGGVGCDDVYRWTRGYMEVTGYIIPTFFDAAGQLGRPELGERAIRMAEWELRVQRTEGGWEGGYEGDGLPTTVFNTGQVIRGLLRTSAETGERRFLEAAERGGRWIVANQEPDGSWARANYKGMRRVYDTYVAAPLAQLALATGDDGFAVAARRNCAFALTQQHENGWFANADNSTDYEDIPVTHTICYTIDGLLETGELLGDDELVRAARLSADALLHKAEIWPRLYGRLDSNWNAGVKYACLTGAAQLGIVFMRLHAREQDPRYLNATLKLVDFLVWVQRLNGIGRRRRGGVTGSYPIWGLYCPLKYPCWATKYLIDLLLQVRRPLAGLV